jgi:hypothetical protein
MIEPLLEAERALEVGLFDKADRLYRTVAERDPRNSIAVVGMARVCLERGDDIGALRLGRRALAIDPENAAAQRLVARLEEVIRTRGDEVPTGMADLSELGVGAGKDEAGRDDAGKAAGEPAPTPATAEAATPATAVGEPAPTPAPAEAATPAPAEAATADGEPAASEQAPVPAASEQAPVPAAPPEPPSSPVRLRPAPRPHRRSVLDRLLRRP